MTSVDRPFHIGVACGGGHARDRLHLLGDPAQGIAGVGDGVEGTARPGGLVAAHLPEEAVTPGVGDGSEGAPGEEAVLGVPGEGEGAGLGEGAVRVVLEAEGVALIHGPRSDPEVTVVGLCHTPGDRPGPGRGGKGGAVVAVGEGRPPRRG